MTPAVLRVHDLVVHYHTPQGAVAQMSEALRQAIHAAPAARRRSLP